MAIYYYDEQLLILLQKFLFPFNVSIFKLKKNKKNAMTNFKRISIVFLVLCFCTSCFEDKDDNPISSRELNDFVWKGMNAYYLYKDEIPELDNSNIFPEFEYISYLSSFDTPENLFESLIFQHQTIDRFSWITNDYIALELLFSGVTNNNGMEFGLVQLDDSSRDIFGYVRYVIPGSNAENVGLNRGILFNGIDNTQLTLDNWRSLMSANTYTINLASYDDNGTPSINDDSIIPSTESIALIKTSLSENPIFKTEIFQVNGQNVGYLMYNGFTPNYDALLNATFGNFIANNVQHLILDLRYNPGGSVNTAILLSSMISGNAGEIFNTKQWNSDIQAIQSPQSLVNRFTNNNNGTPLNILNLNKVYVLTTRSSASASELVINCLNPYMNVVQIGTRTTGKYQASITLYDSPDFRRSGANQNHNYAMQPLVFKTANAVGFTDYNDGLVPDILLQENFGNLGVLGDANELLLSTALQHIEDTGRFSQQTTELLEFVGDSKDFMPLSKSMYDNLD